MIHLCVGHIELLSYLVTGAADEGASESVGKEDQMSGVN